MTSQDEQGLGRMEERGKKYGPEKRSALNLF